MKAFDRRQLALTVVSVLMLVPTGRALVCDPNCAGPCTGRGEGKCDGPCKAGYGLNSFTKCAACDKYCNPADNCDQKGAGKCDLRCITGFSLGSTFACIQCGQHCRQCSSRGKFKCDSKQCLPGYATDSTSVCVACDANCAPPATCSTTGPSKCEGACLSRFVKRNDSTCAPCGLHCAGECTDQGPGYCDKCTTNGCKSCDDGFGLKNFTVNGEIKQNCYSCGPYCNPANGCNSEGAGFCDVCSPAGSCASCLPNYGLVTLPDGLHHACRPCAKYCKSGCVREGGNCCDSGCNSPGRWALKTNTTCHICV